MINIFFILLLCNPINEKIRHYDTVILKTGGSFQGLIQEENGQMIKIALLGGDGNIGGTSVFSKSDLKEIIRRHTPQQIYKEQLRKRNDTDPVELFELAQWCGRDDVGLKKEAIALVYRVLRLDPSNKTLYPLFDKLLSGTSAKGISTESREMQIEFVVRAREQGLFLGESFLRAAGILLQEKGVVWPVFVGEATDILKQVQAQGTAAQAEKALEILADLYKRLDKLDELTEVLSNAPPVLQEKFRSEIVTRLLMRGGEKDLKEANQLIANLPDGLSKQLLKASVAWSGGNIQLAEDILLAAVEQSKSPEVALALALLYAVQGKKETAKAMIALIQPKGMDKMLLDLALGMDNAVSELEAGQAGSPAFAMIAADAKYLEGNVKEAAADVNKLLESHKFGPSFKGLLWALQAKINAGLGNIDKAICCLYYAKIAMPKEGRILLALADLCAQKNEFIRAAEFLVQAKALGVSMSEAGLSEAYISYSKGNLSLAGTIADRLKDDSSLYGLERKYAVGMSRAIWEADKLETWEDTFARADSEDLLRSWNESENFGIKIKIAGRKVLFSGAQRGDSPAPTLMSKLIDWERFARAIFSVKFLRGNAAFGVYAGDGVNTIRIEGGKSGQFNLVTARRDQEKIVPLSVSWHRNRIYNISLEKSAEGDLSVSIDGQIMTIGKGLRFKRGSMVKVGVFVRAFNPGENVELEVYSAKFYRLIKNR